MEEGGGGDPGRTPLRWSLLKLELNIPFLESTPGIFKIAHTLLGLVCLSVMAHHSQFFHPLTGSSLGLLCSGSAACFLLVSYSCFATSLTIAATSALSYFTASFLPKTAFEFAYHLLACLMYLVSSCVLLAGAVSEPSYIEPHYAAHLSAAVLGLINSVLYGISAYFSFQSQREMS